jgi:flagellar FliJ protein
MSKAFEFRLQKLLELRRLEEEAAQREFAAAQAAVAERNQAILGLLNREEEGRLDLRTQQERVIDVVRLRMTREYLELIAQLLDRERAILQDLAKVELDKRRRLTEALKGVRVLERFRERQLRRYRQELDLEERKFLDEIGQNLAKGA